jgi:hypothetical protein
MGLRRQRLRVDREKRAIQGVNLIKEQNMSIWKYHSGTPLYN